MSRTRRYAWRRRSQLSRWENWRFRVLLDAPEPEEPPTGSTLPGAEQLRLMERGRRMCGLLGITALLRAEVDADGDVVLRDLDGVPVAMVRPEPDGSLLRLF